MIFTIIVDIYERTSEPKYGSAMASGDRETEAGSWALTQFLAKTPEMETNECF